MTPRPLRGLGQSVADIERLLGDDPEALARLREELTQKGAPVGNENASKTSANNISTCYPDDLFTEPAPKPKRQTTHGTRKDYTLSRLS